jgi:hypothetical protein
VGINVRILKMFYWLLAEAGADLIDIVMFNLILRA